jgi:hypothetical protein
MTNPELACGASDGSQLASWYLAVVGPDSSADSSVSTLIDVCDHCLAPGVRTNVAITRCRSADRRCFVGPHAPRAATRQPDRGQPLEVLLRALVHEEAATDIDRGAGDIAGLI